jgi:hypothetical protein
MHKKTIAIAALAAIFISGALAAPNFVSPSDSLYRWIDIWSAKGYLAEEGFLLRPYNPEVILKILDEVAAVGSDADRALALEYRSSLEQPEIHLGLRTTGKLSSEGSDAAGAVAGGAILQLGAELSDGLWAAGHMTVDVNYAPSSVLRARGEGSIGDGVYAGGTISKGLTNLLSVESLVFAGGPKLWASAGMGHASFGPFFDNGIVIGPQAPETPYFSLNLSYGNWRYTQALFELQKGGKSNGLTIPTGTDKHVFFHSFSYAPARGWDMGIYEAVVSANRIDPMYFLPLADYFLLQDRSGYGANGALGDNSLAGVYLKGRVLPGLDLKANVFIDDLDYNHIIKLVWDTKWMLAAQGGLSWAPASGPVRLVSADYTAVMPYMYTHYYNVDPDGDGNYSDNYQNDWTTAGENFGPALDPNSDRAEIKAFLPLSGRIELSGIARLIRHGNASAGVNGLDASVHDGSLSDNGWSSVSSDTYGGSQPSYQQPYDTGITGKPQYARFLTQDVIESSWQAGIGASWGSKLGALDLSLSARYLFEYRVNDGLVKDANHSYNYLSFGATLFY